MPHVSNGDNIHVDTKSTISLSNFSLHLFIRILPLLKSKCLGTSQRAQWLRLHHSNAEGVSLIPGQGTKIPYASWHGQKDLKKEKKNKINAFIAPSPSLSFLLCLSSHGSFKISVYYYQYTVSILFCAFNFPKISQ